MSGPPTGSATMPPEATRDQLSADTHAARVAVFPHSYFKLKSVEDFFWFIKVNIFYDFIRK